MSRVRDAEVLLALSLASALAVPGPYGVVVIALGLALAARVRLAHRRVERERESVVRYLRGVSGGHEVAERGAPPNVTDELSRRALATLARREAEATSTRERKESIPPVGVRARFMAAMGHELRSPLNSISGFAQLLEDGSDGPLNDAQRENVVLVRRAAGELITLLTDILDAARIEAGRVRLDRQWIAPVEVLTLALERSRAVSDVEHASVDAQVQPGLSPLFVDRARLGQALFNVLRALVRGRPTIYARVREMREGDETVVRFELHDRGTPVTDADAARAFDPDPAARPQGRSLALGLALSVARDLARLHGGDARAEPLDGGTNWIVWVPAQSDEPPPPRARRATSPARGVRAHRTDPR